MLQLGRKHNPLKNAALIKQLSYYKPQIKSAVSDTDQAFSKLIHQPIKSIQPEPRPSTATLFRKLAVSFARLCLANTADPQLSTNKTIINEHDFIFPDWKLDLDNEHQQLLSQLKKEVNVTDFGAVGDGKTDCTKAFIKAIGLGQVKVIIPEGIFVTKGIRLPSWTHLVGAGKGKTILKLHDQASKGTRLVTNMNHWRGNHHVFIEGMSLDWNVERFGEAIKTCTWGNHSSCLTYANVTYGWVKDVEAMNAGLHGFDVSATLYDYSGDGNKARGGSKYIWLDQLNAYGFGDDGITTHHSEYILISNSHLCDPSGRAHKKGYSNSNGIEVDDGSKNVWLVNNSTTRCFGGVEVKAHHNSSAGNNVQIIGHLSIHDNRSYNFRHIGHHKSTDPNSKTAFYIRATNLISIEPMFTDLYENSTPRAMVISAYVHVIVNHFTLIGKKNYDYKKNPIIAIQYKARNICLKNVYSRGFKTGSTDIRVFGGHQHADQVYLKNIIVEDSAPISLDIGKNVKYVSVEDFTAIAVNGKHALKAAKRPLKIMNASFKGYTTPVLINNEPDHSFK
ncbi:glycoside hydrolase family 55 protein [Mesobacillus maritimus]|uniref:glycoside hydrolase family 55 protein n=1 Tax=Mesobacillus maritimus TaxID=1643336 RepID=UPI00203E9049|nr:glycoside hydrolase family 55 protein [Mesobacillus maritimus]MCM3584198.1 glycoside hydrolase family 55 protein [Mesobacillus maritimus]MCM3669340.1 glycoside hydrolase family 55 protein [Mesobacillus maritimus]